MIKIHLLLRTAIFAGLAIVCSSVVTMRDACATWNLVAQFNQGNAYVIYFIDDKTGFLGFGNDVTPIWKSADSGATWVSVTTPSTPQDCYVSDIWFSSPNDGWATVASIAGFAAGQLWHSTDTGNTWSVNNNYNFENPSSVRRTSKALCVAGSGFGVVFSTDSGGTFTQAFDEPMRGLDFVDSLHIASTPLSSPTYYYSSDGGITWQPSNQIVGDSWGICGIKGTSTYFVAPENQLNLNLASNVYRSGDFGATWDLVCQLPIKTTGGIKGTGCGMFIQNSGHITGNESGIYRSIDQGVTWTSIDGPDNIFDTRFEALDGGQTIYAFDKSGNLWKTTDGGDGFVGIGEHTLAVNATAINFGSGSACNVHDTEIVFTNTGCMPVTVNGWSMSQGSSSFNVYATGQSSPITLEPEQSDSISIAYVSGIGQIYDTVILSSNADSGSVRRIPVEINISGSALPALAIDTSPIVFGMGSICTTLDTTIAFTDTGCAPLVVIGWRMSQSGTGFNITSPLKSDSIILASRQTDSLHITFNSGSGLISDTAIVMSDAANGPAFRIPVEINIVPKDTVNFIVSISPDPVKPDSILTVTVSPDRAVQGVGLNNISGTVEYYSDSYDVFSVAGGTAGETFHYVQPFAIGKTAHLPFTISSATDIPLDPSTPILTLRLSARISDTTVSSFVLDSLLLNGSDPNYGNCVLFSSADSAVSHIELACGDTLLVLQMRNQLAIDVENPQPDPVTSEDGYQSLLTLRAIAEGIVEVRVSDMLGRIISTNNLSLSAGETAHYLLDLSNQPAGTYFYAVRFSSTNGIATKSGRVMVLR